MRAPVSSLLFALLAAACGTSTLDFARSPAPPEFDASGPTNPPSLDGATPAPTFSDEARALGARWTWLDVPNPHETMVAVAGTTPTDVFYAGGCQLRDIAPAPGGRLWIAAGGAILLWDPVTNQLAEAVENVGVRTLVAGVGGEAFGASFPPSGYNADRSDTFHFIPPPDSSTR